MQSIIYGSGYQIFYQKQKKFLQQLFLHIYVHETIDADNT